MRHVFRQHRQLKDFELESSYTNESPGTEILSVRVLK